MRVVVGLCFGQFTAFDQRLHIRVVVGAKRQPRALKVVDARVARVHPVAIAPGVDQKRRDGAVGLLLRGNGGEPDYDVGFFHHALEHGHGVVGVGGVALEQLPRCHHDLVRGLAPPAAPAHAVGDHAQNAAVEPLVGDQSHLVLLVFPVPLVDAGGCDEAKRFGHAGDCGAPAQTLAVEKRAGAYYPPAACVFAVLAACLP